MQFQKKHILVLLGIILVITGCTETSTTTEGTIETSHISFGELFEQHNFPVFAGEEASEDALRELTPAEAKVVLGQFLDNILIGLTGDTTPFGTGTKSVPVLELAGENYPKGQFKLTPKFEGCGLPSWTSDWPVVSAEGTNVKENPDSEGCNYGKLDDVTESTLEMDEDDASLFLDAFFSLGSNAPVIIPKLKNDRIEEQQKNETSDTKGEDATNSTGFDIDTDIEVRPTEFSELVKITFYYLDNQFPVDLLKYDEINVNTIKQQETVTIPAALANYGTGSHYMAFPFPEKQMVMEKRSLQNCGYPNDSTLYDAYLFETAYAMDSLKYIRDKEQLSWAVTMEQLQEIQNRECSGIIPAESVQLAVDSRFFLKWLSQTPTLGGEINVLPESVIDDLTTDTETTEGIVHSTTGEDDDTEGDGDNPRDTPPPEIYGEELNDAQICGPNITKLLLEELKILNERAKSLPDSEKGIWDGAWFLQRNGTNVDIWFDKIRKNEQDICPTKKCVFGTSLQLTSYEFCNRCVLGHIANDLAYGITAKQLGVLHMEAVLGAHYAELISYGGLDPLASQAAYNMGEALADKLDNDPGITPEEMCQLFEDESVADFKPVLIPPFGVTWDTHNGFDVIENERPGLKSCQLLCTEETGLKKSFASAIDWQLSDGSYNKAPTPIEGGDDETEE